MQRLQENHHYIDIDIKNAKHEYDVVVDNKNELKKMI